MKKCYLDIDGVIITKSGNMANNLLEFLKFITTNFNCYWLSTHCKGDAEYTYKYLEKRLPQNCLHYIEKIKATNWNTLKTEAIDFSSEFIWLDDYIMESEEEVLRDHKRESSFIKINLKNNPSRLKELINFRR